ncbi:MAG: serine/threonine-protein kinase [Fuerstiella sp.]
MISRGKRVSGHAAREELRKQLVEIDLEYRLAADSRFDVDAYLKMHRFAKDDIPQSATITGKQPDSDALVADVRGWHQEPVQIGKFAIEKEIGRGGFGIVYRAFDPDLKRIVALKVPKDKITPESRKRFLQEAEATAALEHPGLVPVFETGEIDDVCYIATAFCPGQNLSKWLKARGRIPAMHAAEIIRDLAVAMQHAHDRGIVHRDLKPSNIMAVPRQLPEQSNGSPIIPRITDFGLAKVIEEQLEDTGSSIILGTPSYMAPEQLGGTARSSSYPAGDIYSLGVILFELLAGKRPFERKTVVEVMDAIRKDEPPILQKLLPDLPDDLGTICQKCLAREVEDRYASCGELARDLSLFLNGKPITARPPGLRYKIRHWIDNPNRIRETGQLSIMLGFGVPLWIFVIIIFVRIESLDAQIKNEMIPQTLLITILLLLPLAWVGYQTLHGIRSWVKVGFVLSIVNVLMVSPPLFGHVLVFSDLYGRYPLGKIIAYTFLTLMFGIQVLQYGVLLLSRSLKAAAQTASE